MSFFFKRCLLSGTFLTREHEYKNKPDKIISAIFVVIFLKAVAANRIQKYIFYG